MSEPANEKPVKKDAAEPTTKEKAKSNVPSAQKKDKKEAWTLSKVLNRARRFESVDEWAKGAPSSFKAATNHGWVNKCAEQINNKKQEGVQRPMSRAS